MMKRAFAAKGRALARHHSSTAISRIRVSEVSREVWFPYIVFIQLQRLRLPTPDSQDGPPDWGRPAFCERAFAALIGGHSKRGRRKKTKVKPQNPSPTPIF